MRPLLHVPARSARLTAAVLVGCTVLSGAAFGPAAGEETHAVADRYLDGLDSRHSASAIAEMARGAGYTATAASDGRTADNAWTEALNSSLFAFFGHANAGLIQVKDRAGINDDEYLGAGTTAEVLPLYENYRFWTEFAPFVDIDDMRLAILAGCYSANDHPSLGDFEDVARSRGVDATVAFPGLVYYPSTCTACAYSGNYFWERFAAHYGGGATLSVALSRARTDLVNKEGSPGGWDRYRITGSVTSPGAVRLRPQGSGEPLTSQPLGTTAYSLGSLTVTQTSPLADGEVEQTTDEGVLVRRDAAGDVRDLWAASATTGSTTVASEVLRATSRAFVVDVAGGGEWQLAAEEPVFHLEGERLTRFTWTRAGSSSQIVDVEVDQRTGAVTYLGRAEAPQGVTGTRRVTAEQAARIALADSAPGTEVIAVEQRTWGRPLWVVRTRNDGDRGPLGPQFQEHVIDAVNGEAIRSTTT